MCGTTGNAWGRLELEVGYWQRKDWLLDVDTMLLFEETRGRGVEKCKVGQWTSGGVDMDPLCLGGKNWSTCREGHTGVKCQAQCLRTRALAEPTVVTVHTHPGV